MWKTSKSIIVTRYICIFYFCRTCWTKVKVYVIAMVILVMIIFLIAWCVPCNEKSLIIYDFQTFSSPSAFYVFMDFTKTKHLFIYRFIFLKKA